MNGQLGFRCLGCGIEQSRDVPVGLCPRCDGILLAAYNLQECVGGYRGWRAGRS